MKTPMQKEPKPYLIRYKALTDSQKRERAVRKALVRLGLPFKVAKVAAKNVRKFIANGADPKAAFKSIFNQEKAQLRRKKRSSS